MSAPRSYQTEAIIIKKTRLGEADHILTLYTPGMGKIQGVAKGVRKPKSKMAGHLELLTHSQVSLARGRGSLDTITDARTINAFLPLKSDLWLSACALYATELVNQFAEENLEESRLFKLLLDTLQHLCQAPNKELVLRYFEFHLLGETGYRPQLRECIACHAALIPVVNYFCAPSGGMLCPGCAPDYAAAHPLSLNIQKVMRFLQDADYANAYRLRLDAQLARDLDKVMSSYLEYLLERNLKSAGWLRTLREQFKPVTSPPVKNTPAQDQDASV